MTYTLMTNDEMKQHFVGEAITVTAVMALLTVAIIAVVLYRMFRSNKGTAQIPGGWKFTWN